MTTNRKRILKHRRKYNAAAKLLRVQKYLRDWYHDESGWVSLADSDAYLLVMHCVRLTPMCSRVRAR